MASHQDCGEGLERPLMGYWEDLAGPHGRRADAQMSEGPGGVATRSFGHAHAQRGGQGQNRERRTAEVRREPLIPLRGWRRFGGEEETAQPQWPPARGVRAQ